LEEKAKRVMKTRLEDLAREANVSKATVSLALSGNPKVAAKTVELITKLAAEHNYTPNSFARRLSKRTSETVSLFMMGKATEYSGWLIPSSWLFYNPIFKGVSLTLSEKHYQFSFEFIDLDGKKRENNIISHAQSSSADGLLILIIDESDYSFLENLDVFLPIITINKKLSDTLSSFEIDNYKGANDVVNYLATLGHRKIAHICGPFHAYNAVDRFNGYVASLKEIGVMFREDYVVEGDWNIESGREGMKTLLNLPEPPTAVFCANDHMAIGAMEAVEESGLTIPRDISLIGYDDTEMSRVVRPKLTSVSQPLEKLGRMAANEILRRITARSAPDSKKHVVLPPLLVKRESCCEPSR
jgi:DNA-binding LacI/PurR family transcriptional regulator